MPNHILITNHDQIVKHRLLDDINPIMAQTAEFVVDLGGWIKVVPKPEVSDCHECGFTIKNGEAEIKLDFKIQHYMMSERSTFRIIMQMCRFNYPQYKISEKRIYTKVFTEIYLWIPIDKAHIEMIGTTMQSWLKSAGRILTREKNAVEYNQNTSKEKKLQDQKSKHQKKIEAKTEAMNSLKELVLTEADLADHTKKNVIFQVAETILNTENPIGLHEINKTNFTKYKDSFLRVIKVLRPLYDQ